MAPARRSAANLGVVDLEAPGSSPDGLQNDELVPAQHVRRLTTTVVDILRTIANPRHAAAVAPASGDLDHNHESATLLGDTGSELSIDDKISMSSAGKDSGKDSEISAATALLKAQYLPQAEYRGDDVRPFYMDKRGSTSRLGVEDEFTTIGGSSDVGTEPGDDYPIPRKLIKRKKVNWMGLIVFIFFCCAFVGYVGIRAAKTLGLGGSLWYGIIVLAVEVLGGVAMLPYGLCLTMRVANPPPPAVEAACKGQAAITAVGYHVRVVIPCYKEPLEVIQKTFMAALYAALPANCRRTGKFNDSLAHSCSRASSSA